MTGASLTDPACRSIPLARYPGMNRFVLDWLAGNPNATKFLGRSSEAPAASPGHSVALALIESLIESNRRWGSHIADDLRRWSAGGTVTIITGQQVGFAGGPLYTLAKLASAIKWKRHLAAGGVPATIFFWLASEDHDYSEAATLQVPVNVIDASRSVNRQLDLLTMRAPQATDGRRAVGPLPVPDALIGELIALFDIPRPSWLRAGISFTDSSAELLTSATDGEKVVFVDSLLPELRRAGAPLFESVMARWNDVQRSLVDRSAALRSAGYEPQIAPRDEGAYTLFFRFDEHMNRIAIDHPEPVGDAATISTSAVTRPLLQDAVLRPDIFIGGPAEVAYYAQLGPLHDALGVALPRVAVRGHVLVAPRRVLRAATRHGIEPEEAFRPADAILAEREAAGVAEVKAIAERARRNLAEEITRIGEIALPAEHALARAINRSIGHLEYHFNKLTERAIRGLTRKDRERYGVVKELVSTLYPDGRVQDRVVSWFALWTRYGDALVPGVLDAVLPDDDSFHILGL
ncbi:MAG: bacillithiol biosynthesis protein BshC [Thermoanaerobaculia bacterium]